MHRTTASSSHNGVPGGLFNKGGSIFGGNKTQASHSRPTTSGGVPLNHDPVHGSTTSRTSDFSRKTSLSSNTKSPKSSLRSRNDSTAIYNLSPERRTNLSSRTADNRSAPGNLKPADSFGQVVASAEAASPPSSRDSFTSTTPYSNMLVRPPTTAYQAVGPNGSAMYAPLQLGPASPSLETITYQHIQETSSKRISTLDYLRKA